MEVSMIKTLTTASIVAGTLGLSLSAPVAAGPLPTLTAAVTQAAPDHAVDVYWRGWGPGLGFGLAVGALAGAAIAAPYYGGRYYYLGQPAPYLYARPVYAAPVVAPYAYAPPVYGAPVYSGYAPYGYYYGYRRCYTDEGYGRRTPCDTTGAR
jgi:hypothetical protein